MTSPAVSSRRAARDTRHCEMRALPARISMRRLAFLLTVCSISSGSPAILFCHSGRKSDRADYVRASMRTSRRITVHRSAVSVPISARPVGDGFVEPGLLGEAACLTRPRSVVRDGTSDRRACSSVSPSRQWLRSLAVLVEERLERCPFRDDVGDQHGCCSGTRDRQPAGFWSRTGCGRSGGRSGARSAGRRPEPGNVGLRRSGCCPFRRVPQRRLGPEPTWGTC